MRSEPAYVSAAVLGRGGSDGEVERLRAEVARLQAECDALQWTVGHDELTGLPNRRHFFELAPSRLHVEPAAVLLLDLNGFKPVNDAYGHEAGDRVLQVVAQRLAGCVQNGLIARLGGDEFVGVITGSDFSPYWWEPAVTELLSAIETPVRAAGRVLRISASIGVAIADDLIPIDDLVFRADMAMYEAKIHGFGYAAWSQEMGWAHGAGEHVRSTQAWSRAHIARPAEQSADVPTVNPYRRDPADIALGDSYQRGDKVWVYRQDAWYPGVVERASRLAVTATYRRAPGSGTVADTMGAECLMGRTSIDQLDTMYPAPALDRLRATA